ncbi:MAG: HD domain-containing protein, partial [Oscillospiraceae bacterium]
MNFTEINGKGAVEAYAIIKQVEKKVTAKGANYLDMILSDKDGDITAKLWDYNEAVQGVFQSESLVKVRGTVSQYNGSEQLRIEKIRPVIESDDVKIEDFIQSAAYSSEYMYSQIEKIANSFKDEDIKKVVITLLHNNKEDLLRWPAAFKLHHAIRGGLLMHTLSIVKLCEGVCKVYPFVDKDLLFAGAILHDIAKTTEYDVGNAGIASGYTTEGNLIGHLVRGAMMIDECSKKLGIPSDKAMLLEHMVISHHGEPDFGAAVRPMFLEAELLSELDLMDARVYQIVEALNPLDE